MSVDLGLQGKYAVVTGGSKGIGRAIALALARKGAHVAICARGHAALRDAERQLLELGGKVVADVCDVADPVALDGFLESARKAFGRLDILVNNPSALAPQKIRVNVIAPGSIEFAGGLWEATERAGSRACASVLMAGSVRRKEWDPKHIEELIWQIAI